MKQNISPAATASILAVLAIVIAVVAYQLFFAAPRIGKTPKEAGPIPAPPAPAPPGPQ